MEEKDGLLRLLRRFRLRKRSSLLGCWEGKKGPKHGRCRTHELSGKGITRPLFPGDRGVPRKIKLVSRVMGNLPARFGEH
jgi:hypothetical protein